MSRWRWCIPWRFQATLIHPRGRENYRNQEFPDGSVRIIVGPRGWCVATLERSGPGGHDLVVLDDTRPRLSIGKNPDNHLVIDGDTAVSRAHAVLERVGPFWCITDVGSMNGTMVNGKQIFAPRTLVDRDEILVGRTLLVLHDQSARHDTTTERVRQAPARTGREQDVLIELCRPVLSGHAFTPPASVTAMAEALYVTEAAVRQHLGHLYDKFLIESKHGESRRVLLANEAIQTGAVALRDLRPRPPAAGPTGRT
jgi:hypothetical protein